MLLRPSFEVVDIYSNILLVTVYNEADITAMTHVGALHTRFRNGTLRRKIFFVGQAGSKSSYSCGNVIKLDWTGLSSPGQSGRSATLEVPLWNVQTINQQVNYHFEHTDLSF